MHGIIWNMLGVVLLVLSLPGTVELLLLTVFGLLPLRKTKSAAARPLKIAVIIPAHDEELHIEKAIKSLLSCDPVKQILTVVVTADNCSDRTAALAGKAGACVLERNDLKNRGKGPALNFAFRHLEKERYDAFIVIDADTVVERNFIAEFNRFFQAGAEAVQCRYLVANPDVSPRTRLMDLALQSMHVLRPRGRSRMSVSCGIFGNGFGLTRDTLEAVPYLADSIVEDLEYHIALVQAGKKVHFINGTTVRAEFPAGGKGMDTQRSRWEGGRLRVALDKSPLLLKEIMKGNFRLIEPLLELLTLPLAYHVLLLTATLIIPVLFIRIYAIAAFGIVMIHILTAIIIGGEVRGLFTLLFVPFYIIWKISRLSGILKTSNKKASWKRTTRKEGG